MDTKNQRPIGLYVHIPFCRARCLYCRFPARPAGTFTQTQYIENLIIEIRKWIESNPGFDIRTIYIGGGTPSSLNIADIELLLKTLMKFGPDATEVSFEANPHPDDLQKIPILFDNGVNRISVGVQSFIDDELAQAGRLHTADDTREFLRECRRAGFKNISLDLIHGLPNQTISSFENSLRELLEFNPEHVSLYGLMIESDSRLGQLSSKVMSKLNLPDGDDQAEMYDISRRLLGERSYEQYEIANFARKGFECTHNISYWTGGEFIGFGPGAASYIKGARFKRISDVDRYLAALSEGKNTVEYLENLSTTRAAAEAVVMGLRRTAGISRSGIETRFGVKLTEIMGDVLNRYEKEGLLEVVDDNIRLRENGYFLSDAIFRDMVQ